MGQDRIPYPKEYYEKLRVEENFGCAVCGIPLCRIHHIEGYKGEHILSELILLCKEHHEQSDKRREHPELKEGIEKEKLYDLKKNPFNRDKIHHNFAISSSNEMIVHLGGNILIENPICLEIFGESIIMTRREQDQLLISANFYDKSDSLMLKITDNIWEADTNVADLRYSEGEKNTDAWLAVKMIGSSSYLDVKIKDGELYIEGKFYRRGLLFDVREDGIFNLTDCLRFQA
jgi:hypothetical protein